MYSYHSIALEPYDCAAIIHLPDNRICREEIHYGNSYLSHSSRRLWLPRSVRKIEIFDYQGKMREVSYE
jgi:hypothetical protein